MTRKGEAMTRSASVRIEGAVKRHGKTTVLHGIDLEVHPGEFFALLGPSGSGKTTTLRLLAGLETLDGGRVFLDGVDVSHAEPGERDVAMVFQSYALYPHMTVRENIAFPLKMIGEPADRIAAAVIEAAERVGIGHLLERRPGQLSGGQQQRCALARAIVRKPRLFLLDEPLSNLDAKLRLETRAELRRLQRSLGVTAVYVTHDQEEAMTIADRIAIFMDGRLAQVGTPHAIFDRPASAQVAAFIGTPPMNLLKAVLHGNSLEIGTDRLACEGLIVPGAGAAGPSERVSEPERTAQAVLAGIRPGDLEPCEQGGLVAEVEFVEDFGDSAIINLMIAGTRARMRSARRELPAEGTRLRVRPKPESVHLFAESDGQRIEL
jgi:ABC-type sugar transport system ATPase subunit